MNLMEQAAVRRARAAMDLIADPEDKVIRPARAISYLGMSSREVSAYSLASALSGLARASTPMGAKDSLENECSEEIRKRIESSPADDELRERLWLGNSILVPREVLDRALSTASGGKGGYLVGNQQIGFIDVLRARSVCMRMGARALHDLRGSITAGRATAGVSITWQAADGTSITAADQTLGQLSMTPKTCIAITDTSEQLLRQISPSADNFIALDLAGVVADAVDDAAINGTGGAQPLGIVNAPGITSGADAGTATQAKLLAIPTTAGTANALRGNPGWLANSAGASLLMGRQRFTGTDAGLWTGNILDGEVVGFPAASTEKIASGNLIFGSWDELVIGDWGVLELATDRGGTRFNTGQVGIRAMWMVDVMLRYPKAFVVSTSLS